LSKSDSSSQHDNLSNLSFNKIVSYAAKSSAIYTFGLLIPRLGEFLLIPIYWSLLTPADYGTIAVAAIFTEFLTQAFGLGFADSITRYYYEWKDQQRKHHLGAVWTMAWGSAVVMGLIVMNLESLFSQLITQIPFSPYLTLAIWIAVCNSAAQTPLFLFRAMEKAGLYISTSVLTFILNTVFAILFIYTIGEDGALAILGAQAISGAIMTVIYTVILFRLTTPNIRYKYWGTVVKFSLPLVPAKVIVAASAVVDRFLLEKFISLSDLGLYQVATRFARVARLVTNGLRTAWIPLQMRIITERPEDGRDVVGRMAPYFIFVLLLTAISLATIIGDLIQILNIPEYLPVIMLLPFAVVPEVVSGIAMIVVQGYVIAKKTQYVWISTTTQLITAVVANILLIPAFGVYGTFAATTLSVLAGGLVSYAFSVRFYYIPFPWRKIGVMVASALLAAAIAYAIEPGSHPLDLGLSIILVFCYTLLIWLGPLKGYEWIRRHGVKPYVLG
jgi:O-antigen/teichoic acid export membrane protein